MKTRNNSEQITKKIATKVPAKRIGQYQEFSELQTYLMWLNSLIMMQGKPIVSARTMRSRLILLIVNILPYQCLSHTHFYGNFIYGHLPLAVFCDLPCATSSYATKEIICTFASQGRSQNEAWKHKFQHIFI